MSAQDAHVEPTDRALVAVIATGERAYIVDWYGEAIEDEVAYAGDLVRFHNIELCPETPGLHVWEGSVRWGDDAEDEDARRTWRGTWRQPDDEETRRYVSGIRTWPECDGCVEQRHVGGAWHAHACGLPNVEITQEKE